MFQFAKSPLIFIPVFFSGLLFFFGNVLAEWVIGHTPLIAWLEANKIEHAYRGVDFSLMPLCATLVFTFALSVFLFKFFVSILDAVDYMLSPPATGAAEPSSCAEKPKQQEINPVKEHGSDKEA
ncbi:hypothetical protein ACNJ8R_004130 [Cronobacter sakazakii]|nr:hypothetical protein [Cronobacter sakazakii]EJV9557822.1 hypothetical protein [Cronobacter sakazakii]EJV9561877.1 hypothetical protein [Cronobacter sakazakii]EJX1223071.1 hypothetical protein [Cronobacter sakazakii]EJX4594394.1 hypothetical protein [Cronobacter sakazakii]